MQSAIKCVLRGDRLAIPLPTDMSARNAHCQIVGAPLEPAGVEHPYEHVRGELLQITRDGEHHCRCNFEKCSGEILGVFAKMRHYPRDERQRNSDVAAEHMTHGQKNDCTVRLSRSVGYCVTTVSVAARCLPW